MNRSAWLIVALALSGLAGGCVTRRYVITSDPPGAMVYRNGQPIGATPVEESFVYYGKYHFRLVADGKQPQDVVVDFDSPWYEYPGVDFIFENLVPCQFRDVHPVHVCLVDEQQVPEDQVRARAEELRRRGKEIASPLAGVPRPSIRTVPPPVVPAPQPPAPQPPVLLPPIISGAGSPAPR